MPIGNTTFAIHHIKDIGFSGSAGGSAEDGGWVKVWESEGVAGGGIGFGGGCGGGRGARRVGEEGVEEEGVHGCGWGCDSRESSRMD